MNWLAPLLDQLALEPACGYRRQSTPCTEPTALAAIALLTHNRLAAAQTALAWLLAQQQPDGALGISTSQSSPHWPTSHALIAWHTACRHEESSEQLTAAMQRGADWLLSVHGVVIPPTPQLGHDSTLLGWPWVESTHSWFEPTAWSVIALKLAGYDQHPRVREAVRLLIDRLLPEGGCNYGNSFVLGNKLRPHVAPSGLALLALSGEVDPSGRIEATVDYLQRVVSSQLAPQSLSYALLGLAAAHAPPDDAAHWLQLAAQRAIEHRPDPPTMALLALTAHDGTSPFTLLPRQVLS